MTGVEGRLIPFDAHRSIHDFTPHSYEEYRAIFGEDFEDRIRAAARELRVREEISFLPEDHKDRKHPGGSVAEYVVDQYVRGGLGVFYTAVYVPQGERPGGSSHHSHDDGSELYRGVFGKVVIFTNDIPNILTRGATLRVSRNVVHHVRALDEWSVIAMITENPNRLPRELLHRRVP